MKAHPLLSWGGLALLVGWLWDRFSDYQTGSGLMETLFGPDWLSTITSSPWFTVVVIGAAFWCFWRIGATHERAVAGAQKREGEKARAMLEPLAILVEERLTQDRLRYAKAQSVKTVEAMKAYAVAIDQWEAGPPRILKGYGTDKLKSHAEGCLAAIKVWGAHVDLDIGDAELRLRPMHKTPNHAASGMMNSGAAFDFDPAANGPYFSNHRADYADLQSLVTKLKRSTSELARPSPPTVRRLTSWAQTFRSQ